MTAPEVADQAPDDNKATAPEVSAPLAWNSNAAPGSYPYSPKWNPLASLLLNNKAPEGLDSTLDRQHLTNLQEDIEKLTLASKADISSIYHTVPSLITLFMDSKEPTAQLMNRSISLDDRILINSLAYEKDTHVKHFQPPVPPRLPCYDFTPGPSSEPHPILLTPAN